MLLTLLHQWESKKRKRSAMSTTTANMPLSGAIIWILGSEKASEKEQHAELVEFCVALGGRVVSSVSRAEIVLLPSASTASSSSLSNEQTRILRECKQRDIPIVETSWLERVSGLEENEHWSEINLDSHVPPMVALLDEQEENEEAEDDEVQVLGTRMVESVANRWHAFRRDAQSRLGRSISETLAHLVHENPDEMEEEAIRRAIELSMLDCALVDYNPDAAKKTTQWTSSSSPQSGRAKTKSPHELLQVAKDASPSDIKAAYRKLARIHHPDKGGDSNTFEAIARAYRTLLSQRTPNDASFSSSQMMDTQKTLPRLKTTAHWDMELQDHRRLVQELFQAHGSNLDSCIRKQEMALKQLGLEAQDAGATNRNEKDQQIRNSCFYLSLAASYLSGIEALVEEDPEADKALIGETALQLKRVIEAAVVKAHPEWAAQGMVGEEVQAFSDFLTYSLDGEALLSDWAVVVFDASSGFCDAYKGSNYGSFEDRVKDPAWARSNTITLLYTPGHYQPLMATNTQRPTLEQVLRQLDATGVFYVVTDGSS